MKKRSAHVLLLCLLILSCGHPQEAETEPEQTEITTPVTVTSVIEDSLVEYIELNATSAFLRQGIVKASANGYVTAINALPGKLVTAGQELFTIKTKEAQSIGNTINALDSTFKFSGIIHIRSTTSGFVSEVNHVAGDYVQDGEQLAIVTESNSFVFVMNVPYELRPYVLGKRSVLLLLPDGKSFTGNISATTPIVDSASQTQNVFITVKEKNLPVNLIARVKLEKMAKPHAVSLPRQAVLSDESLTNFWVMKLIDSTTAVKLPITKGIETNDRIEILSPRFLQSDKFVLSGNYGLPDTARIRVVQQEESQ